MAEGAPLLREYGLKAHRGFESLSLRHNTTTEKEIDYQAYMRENPSDMPNIIHGPEAREKRREAAMKRILQDKQSEDHDTQ